MAQHDLNIANQVASTARTDINNALVALGTTLSGTSAPSLTTEGTLWYDTTNNTLKIREGSSWVSIGEVDGSTFKANVGYASTAQAQNGTDTPLTMNPARVKEAITAQTVSSIGVGQTWQAFSTSTRVNNVWYQNLTTLPIQVAIDLLGGGNAKIYVSTTASNGVQLASWPSNDGNYERSSFSFIVPVNHYYKCTAGTRITWAELRA